MVKQWRQILFVLGLCVGLALLFVQAWRSYEAFQRHGLTPSSGFISLGIALALNLAIQLIQMLAWLQIMQYLGYSLPLTRVLGGYMVSFLPRYIPGSVWGYLGRSEWLASTYRIDYTTSITGSALEGLGLIATGLSFAGFYLSRYFTGLPRTASVIGVAVLFYSVALLLPKLAIYVIERTSNKTSPAKLRDRHLLALSQARPSLSWLTALVLYLILWGIYGIVILMIGNTVTAISISKWFELTTSFSLSWIAGFISPFVPTGIGIREFALASLLTRLAGVFPWQGSWIAVVSRLIAILSESIWVIAGLLIQVNTRQSSHDRANKRRMS